MSLLAQKFADQHLKFLQEHNPAALQEIRRSGDLNSYLSSVGQQAEEMYLNLMHQYANSKEVQNLPHLRRIRSLQSRQYEAEEIVRQDLVFQPLPETD